MYLLCQSVGRKRDIEAIGAGHTPDGDDDVGVLVDGEITRAGRAVGTVEDRRAAQLEEGLGLGLRADLAEHFCQKLLSRHKVLRRPANTEGNLLDGGVAPALREGVVARLGGQETTRIVAEGNDNVLEAVTGGDNESARSRRLAGEVIREPGVVLHGNRFHTAVFGVGVI